MSHNMYPTHYSKTVRSNPIDTETGRRLTHGFEEEVTVPVEPKLPPGVKGKQLKDMQYSGVPPPPLKVKKNTKPVIFTKKPKVEKVNGKVFVGAEKRGVSKTSDSMRSIAVHKVGLNQIMSAGHPTGTGRLWP